MITHVTTRIPRNIKTKGYSGAADARADLKRLFRKAGTSGRKAPIRITCGARKIVYREFGMNFPPSISKRGEFKPNDLVIVVPGMEYSCVQ
jgi:hypothetical protein